MIWIAWVFNVCNELKKRKAYVRYECMEHTLQYVEISRWSYLAKCCFFMLNMHKLSEIEDKLHKNYSLPPQNDKQQQKSSKIWQRIFNCACYGRFSRTQNNAIVRSSNIRGACASNFTYQYIFPVMEHTFYSTLLHTKFHIMNFLKKRIFLLWVEIIFLWVFHTISAIISLI